jgi:hypothetical protein
MVIITITFDLILLTFLTATWITYYYVFRVIGQTSPSDRKGIIATMIAIEKNIRISNTLIEGFYGS